MLIDEGPIIGEELTTGTMPEGVVSPTPQYKGGLPPFKNESPRDTLWGLKQIGILRVNSRHPISMTLTLAVLLDDHTASDDLNDLINFGVD